LKHSIVSIIAERQHNVLIGDQEIAGQRENARLNVFFPRYTSKEMLESINSPERRAFPLGVSLTFLIFETGAGSSMS